MRIKHIVFYVMCMTITLICSCELTNNDEADKEKVYRMTVTPDKAVFCGSANTLPATLVFSDFDLDKTTYSQGEVVTFSQSPCAGYTITQASSSTDNIKQNTETGQWELTLNENTTISRTVSRCGTFEVFQISFILE